jgi:hypothetical protein
MRFFASPGTLFAEPMRDSPMTSPDATATTTTDPATRRADCAVQGPSIQVVEEILERASRRIRLRGEGDRLIRRTDESTTDSI